jgi:flagellar hook-associated protein 1
MVNALNTSLAGLLAFQRALSTTSHNIANSGTEGYSRQRVNFGTAHPHFLGGQYHGTGVRISSVERIYDQFLVNEVRSGVASESRLDTFYGLSSRVGNLLGSESQGLSASFQSFFSSVQALANDPASMPVRQAMLSETGSLVQRVQNMDARLGEMAREVDNRVAGSVDEINTLADALAELNRRIASSPGAANGNHPPDLLDRRDQLLARLAEQVEISTTPGDNGMVNVFIGQGQTLVLGNQATNLETGPGPYGPGEQAIYLGGVNVGSQLTGGKLGGLLDFVEQTLNPTRNDLGRAAVTLAQAFNATHRQGMDLNGNLGGDYFAVGSPQVMPSSGNSGSSELATTIDDVGALTGDDYRMQFDGSNWTLFNTTRGETVALSGSGTAADPFSADGLSIVVSGTPDAGDRFRIRPTYNAASGLEQLVRDPEAIAAASPLKTGAGLDNVGNAVISSGEIVDIDHPDLLEPVTITFIDENTYEIDGITYAYTSGDDIEINGWRVQIDGTPAAGDEFSVVPNFDGEGDNRNALALAGLRDEGLLGGGQRSLLQHTDSMITSVGATTAAVATALESESALLASSRQALESVRGVNLEEEAANLMRYRQAYEASAQMIQTTNSLFQSLLAAVR